MTEDEYDAGTFGGQLRRIEEEAKRLGAPGILAQVDQVRALHREKVFEALGFNSDPEGTE